MADKTKVLDRINNVLLDDSFVNRHVTFETFNIFAAFVAYSRCSFLLVAK